MEIHLRSVGKASTVSSRPFEAGAAVESFLFRSAEGILDRADLHVDEVSGWNVPGPIVCRWRHRIRERDDAEADARRSALLTAEELFFALIEAEEAAAADEAADVRQDRRVLLTLIALMLERRRVLKSRGRGRYWHPGTKREVRVQPMRLTPEEILSVQEQLGDLI